jgi:endonuclease/exonuclease/phosphatase family metal-dependent hydrolase
MPPDQPVVHRTRATGRAERDIRASSYSADAHCGLQDRVTMKTAARARKRPVIRVLTVNTHKGFAQFNRRFVLRELRDAVRAVNADLVFLQEVQGTHTPRSQRVAGWPDAPHYEFLADQLWPQFAYGRNAVYPQGDHGNALLSKYPIVADRNHDASVGRHESRGLLHCALAVPGSDVPLHAICVHLGLQARHRHLQLAVLGTLIDEQVPADAALVVAGDFNDWRDQASPLLLRRKGLHEVFVHAFGRSARTFPARWPLLRLDRIYVRNTSAHAPLPLPARPWSRLSDHAPLAAELTL